MYSVKSCVVCSMDGSVRKIGLMKVSHNLHDCNLQAQPIQRETDAMHLHCSLKIWLVILEDEVV